MSGSQSSSGVNGSIASMPVTGLRQYAAGACSHYRCCRHSEATAKKLKTAQKEFV